MKTPPPSPQDSPALLYLLALCDPAHDKQTNTYFNYLNANTNNNNQYINTPGTMSPNYNNNLDMFAGLGGGMPGGGGGGKAMGGINIDEAIRQLRKHLPGAMSRLHHFLLRMNK